MIDPAQASAARPTALDLDRAGAASAVRPGAGTGAAGTPDRWLGQLPEADGPIVGEPSSARATSVEESAARVLARLGAG